MLRRNSLFVSEMETVESRGLSKKRGIGFGTRGSEVQILSPRPIKSITYKRIEAAICPITGAGAPLGAPIRQGCC